MENRQEMYLNLGYVTLILGKSIFVRTSFLVIFGEVW